MSYLIRGIWDTFVWPYLGKKYIYTLLSITFGILWDCVPIMLILVLHYKNFREKDFTVNEIRKAAAGRSSGSARSDDIDTTRQEVFLLDYAAK